MAGAGGFSTLGHKSSHFRNNSYISLALEKSREIASA